MSDDDRQQEKPAPTPGGLGGNVHGVRDTRMEERAIRQRWPISDKLRAVILARMEKIASDDNASPREVNAVLRSLVAADRSNQAEEREDYVSLQKYTNDIAAVTELLLGVMTPDQRADARKKVEEFIREESQTTI